MKRSHSSSRLGSPRALSALGLAALSLVHCAGGALPLAPRPDTGRPRTAAPSPSPHPTVAAPPAAPSTPVAPPEPAALAAPADGGLDAEAVEVADGGRCAGVPPLGPDGSVPPAPPHAPLGEDVEVPGDRPVYVLPGNPGDSRVIVYLHGMCGDVTAADYFREAVRAHGTLIALRGDTWCHGDRFKWRADSATIQARVRAAFRRVNEARGGDLVLEPALLIGYSQGADRAEKLAQRFPKQYPRLVLGGPPTKPSPHRLARAERVVILGGELETTENMRAGEGALQAAGIASRFVMLECAYHGYFGTNAEAQLDDVLDWLSEPLPQPAEAAAARVPAN